MNILFLFLLLIILMVVIQLYFRESNMFESFSFENQKILEIIELNTIKMN